MNMLPSRIHGLFKGLLGRLRGRNKRTRTSPGTLEQLRFERDVRDQFLQLKKKGLSIPIFTL